ncbi:MAG: SOUL family heme-binding protein [Halorhodospira sp.]
MKILLWTVGVLALLLIGATAAWWLVIRGVETPSYSVLMRDGELEVRDYPPLRVAEVVRRGSRGRAVSEGFRPLAGYIFARERRGASIAMTAPVTQTPVEEDEWLVRFIMPQGYSLEQLPQPASEEVTLRELEAQRMAAIRFSGRADDRSIQDQDERLRAWLEQQGLVPDGAPVYAYYDDPFTPGFLRRNEVLIPVRGEP